MNRLIIISICIFSIIFCNTSTAQNKPSDIDYELIIQQDNHISLARQAIGIENNEAFIVYVDFNIGDEISYNILAHLNPYGEIDNKITFPKDDFVINEIYYIGKMNTPNSYLAMGFKQIEQDSAFLITVFKFNYNLQIEWEKVIDTMYYDKTNKYPRPKKMMFKFWNNTYYLMVGGHIRYDQYQRSSLYKMDSEGNILLRKDIEPAQNGISTDLQYIAHIPGTTQFIMNKADRETTDYRSWIMNDETLELVSVVILPDHTHTLADDIDMEYINETEFIYSGRPLGFGSERHMGLRKGTISNPMMKTRYFHWDRFDGPVAVRGGWTKTMAMQNNYFYFGLVDQMYNKTNNLIVTAFNYELDSLWTAYLKNDADYALLDITPMTDGSCLLAARRYFYDDFGGETSDAYFVKIKTPEVLEGYVSVDERSENVDIDVYPNPTDGQLRITNYELGIDYIEVFDMLGRNYSLSLEKGRGEVNISHLPAGVYFIRITTETGVVTKKVVKQ